MLEDGIGLTLLAVSGVAAGVINVMAGGGSMLTLPVLMLLGLPADVANGTNRLSIITQSATGVLGFRAHGKLPTESIGKVITLTMVGALAGAVSATMVPEQILKPVLLGTMIVMAFVFALLPPVGRSKEQDRFAAPRRGATLGLLLAGFYGGFIQAGVGFVLLAVFSGLLGNDLVRANALKLLCTLCFGSVALGVFVVADQVAWPPAIVLAIGTVLGAWIGVKAALRIGPDALRWVVLVCVVAVSIAAWFR